MSTTFTTAPIKQLLSYPFKDERWKGKAVIGVLLLFGNIIIPILPALFVNGYYYQIMHRILVGDGEMHLPEWDDWGKLLKDGWRLFCVNFVYGLPGVLFILVGVVLYFVGTLGIGIAGAESSIPDDSVLLVFLFFGIMFVCLCIGSLLSILGAIVSPPALCNAVKHDSFAAAFHFSEWWQVVKANFGGFLIAILLIYGVSMIVSIIGQLFYMTMICCALMYVVMFIGSFYIALIYAALIPLVYKEGLDKLEE